MSATYQAIHAFNEEMKSGQYGNLLLDLQATKFGTYSNIFAEHDTPICVYIDTN